MRGKIKHKNIPLQQKSKGRQQIFRSLPLKNFLSFSLCSEGLSLTHLQQKIQNINSCLSYRGTGTKNAHHAGIVQELVILVRNNPSGNHHDVFASQLLKLSNHLGNQGLVTCSQGRNTQYVHIVFHSLLGCFGRGLEQGTHVHVETNVGITCSHHLGTAVVSVLAHLGHHNAGLTALCFGKFARQCLSLLKHIVVSCLRGVNTIDRSYHSLVSSYFFFTCIRNLTQRGTLLSGIHSQLQEVAFTGFHTLGNGFQGSLHVCLIAFSTQFLQTLNLRFTHCSVVHIQNIDGVFLFQTVTVGTHDNLLATVDLRLSTGSRLFDTHFGQTGLYGLGHSTHFFHFLNQSPGLIGQFLGQRLHIIRAGPGINSLTNLGFLLNVNLGITGNTRREIGRQSNRLIERIGVQRLGVSQGSGHRLNTGTPYVVERILLGQRPTRSLRVRTQSQRLGIFGAKLLHNLGPQHTGSAHLGNFHKVVHAHGPEKGQARCKSIHIHTGINTGTQVLQTVGQGISQLNVGSSSGLLHVVARNRDAVELRHILRGVLKDIGDDLHGELRRIDVGVPHHKLLQNVVLNGSGHIFQLTTLLQSGHNVKSHYGQHSAVHGHGYRHFVERNAVEEHLHIEDGVDGHTGLTHITHYPLVVGVVAPVCSQVKCHRKAFLTRCQVAPVKGVRLFSSRKAGILTDGPGTHGVHARIGTTQEGGQTGSIVQMLHAGQIFLGINRLNGNLFGGHPVLLNPVFLGPVARRSSTGLFFESYF